MGCKLCSSAEESGSALYHLCTNCVDCLLSFVCLFVSLRKDIEASKKNALQVSLTLELFFFALATVNYRFKFPTRVKKKIHT